MVFRVRIYFTAHDLDLNSDFHSHFEITQVIVKKPDLKLVAIFDEISRVIVTKSTHLLEKL